MKIKNTDFEIVKGDITSLSVDAIVNPANEKLTMEAGLAGIIKKNGGEEIEKEAVDKGPIQVGEAIQTRAGNLSAEYIIHAATVSADQKTDEFKIRAACANALALASSLKLSSLALPALGCGVAGFPPVGSAKIMTQEILKHARYENTTLKRIVLCLFEEEMYQTFLQTASGYVTHIQDTLGDGPYVTVDIIIEMDNGIIVIERSNPPYGLALPGGFVDYGESLEETAIREAKEETNMDLEDLRQFHTYSKPGRDPRFQTVSTVFIAKGKGAPKFGDDAKGLKVVEYENLLKLDYAFDHIEILKDYLSSKK